MERATVTIKGSDEIRDQVLENLRRDFDVEIVSETYRGEIAVAPELKTTIANLSTRKGG
jgi:hypothetical protein